MPPGGTCRAQRRLYSIIGFGGLAWRWCGRCCFADESNAGHFFDRLPHLFDFLSWLIPHDWNDVCARCSTWPSPSR